MDSDRAESPNPGRLWTRIAGRVDEYIRCFPDRVGCSDQASPSLNEQPGHVNSNISSITITGTYRSSNRGDAAMQLVGLQRLRGPGRRVVIDSPFPTYDADLYGLGQVIRCGRRSGSLIILPTARAAVVAAQTRLGLREAHSLLLTEELRHLGDPDGIVVDLSGDMLTEDYGLGVGISHFVPLVQAQLLGTPVVVCAQSVGPFKRLRPLARAVLSRCHLVTLRDEISLDHVRDLDVDATVTADIAFLLEPDERSADLVLSRYCLTDRPFLAVSVSPILEKRFESRNPGRRFADVVAQGLEPAITAGLAIAFVPHVTGPGPDKDDRIAAARVAAHLGGRCVQITEEMSPATTKGVIGRAEGIVGCRMHANIAALSQGVPVAALSYSHKTAGIMAGFDQADMVLDGSSLDSDKIRRMVAELVNRRSERARQITSALPTIREQAKANFTAIENLIQALAT